MSVGSAVARTLAALALATVLASGCTAPPDTPTAPVQVRTAIGTDPVTTALYLTSDTYSNTIGLLVSDALLRYDQDDLALVPRVAESWTLSPDHRTLTFRLRDGVRWHDGTPVTATDVVFTVAALRDPKNLDRNAPAQFEGVEVRAADDRTVVATYRTAGADMLDSWTFPLVPAHLAGRDEDLVGGAFAAAPVGCGPFRFVRHVRGDEIVLEANDDHWAGRPAIDRLVFKVMRDQHTAVQALLTGDLELLAMTPALYREALDSGRAGSLRGEVYPRMSAWYAAFNVRRPALADARVRRAVVHLLDREAFAREMLDGMARIGVTTWHPDNPWADRALAPLAYDPDRARALLAEAGFADRDGDGVLDRDGEPFRIVFLYARGSQPILDQFAAWFQQSLADGGIEVRLEALEFQAYKELRDAGRFDVAMGSFGLDVTGDQTELYHSASIGTGFNFFGWADPETDRLLELGRATFDPAERRAAYARLQRRLLEQSPIATLFYLETPLLLREELRGVRPTALGLFRAVPGPAGWRWDAAAGRDR